jgi:hypothetical protein
MIDVEYFEMLRVEQVACRIVTQRGPSWTKYHHHQNFEVRPGLEELAVEVLGVEPWTFRRGVLVQFLK